MPASSASRGECNSSGSPCKRISPSSGRYSPVRMLDSVVLPAPFSPRSAWTSPRAASKSTWSLATTAGKRLVTPRNSIAGREGGAEAPPSGLSALGATDDALDEPVHRVQVLDSHALALGDAELPLLVVERSREFVERALDQSVLLLRDGRLGLRADLRPVRGEADHAILDVAVVEVRLPRAVHRRLRLAQVVRPPVVDRGGEPLLRRELVRVRVVADPRNALRLGELTGRGAVDVLPQHVRAGRVQALRRFLLLARVEPRVRPDQPNFRARMRRLRAECEGIRMPDDFRSREGNDVAEHALPRRCSRRHP